MELMTRKDIERATEFIKKRFQGCPNCGALKVQMHDVIGLPLLSRNNSSGYSIDKLSLVALPLICDSCGNIMLFTAKNILKLE